MIAVFLAAYSIPVTFHTVMTVAGGNSLANTVSATPGGVGINQAINTASLSEVTTPANAAAYSTGQQLIVTAFNVVFGAVLVVWAFGWSGGRTLVEGSYADAKTKVAEQKADRAAKKEAKRELGGGRGRRQRAHVADPAPGRGGAVSTASPREIERPRIRPVRLLVAWVLSAAALLFAAWVMPGVHINGFGGALVAAALIALLNAILPPFLAALRLPFTLVLGLLLVLVADAAMFVLVSEVVPDALTVDSWWAALGAAFVASIASVILDPIFRTNDDEAYMLRVTQRIARRSGEQVITDVPGIVFLEIDGLALPVLRRAMRDGNAPVMARWLADGGYELTEWETDLSSQTGASQAGILLGSNEDISAFRWIEKESGRTMTCSRPEDCAEIEARRSTGVGLLRDGGASRGNLLSGEADHLILTVSRLSEEKRSNPGYRAFFANGFNVTRVLVLFFYEVILEWSAAIRSSRRDVRPRGHRGGIYPLMRAAMCVIVRDLIVFGVISDLMRGPARDLRDVLELRRGGAPLGARALGHARGAAEARPAVRPDRARAPVRGAAVRDRRPLRPRPDAGGDVPAAERLQPGRSRRAARSRAAPRPRPDRATRTTPWSGTR